MRYAVFAVTAKGIEKASEVSQILVEAGHSVQAYFKAGRLKSSPAAATIKNNNFRINEYNRLSGIIEGIFRAGYDGLIFVMATGIVVRTIAPYIVSKLSDPAVLVMDEEGKHVISLLSGHVGGANALTLFLAHRLNSDPVITTATDVNNILAPDALAQGLELTPYPMEAIEIFNSGLLAGKPMAYVLDEEISCIEEYKRRLSAAGIVYRVEHITQEALSHQADALASANTAQELADDMLTVIITSYHKLFAGSSISENSSAANKLQKNSPLPFKRNRLYLYPRRLAAGIGCRRDTPSELIAAAVERACREIGWPVERIDLLASTVVKQDEKGLLDFAKAINRQITFYENRKLQEVIDRYNIEESSFVKKTIGIGNVSEAAALACFANSRVALGKTKYERVTVSLAWEK